jgi:hypothetical protein
VRGGTEHKLPETWSKILRQPLFGNTHLKTQQGLTLATEDNTRLFLWANKGFLSIADLWQEDSNSWISVANIKHIIRSPRVHQQHQLIIEAVPWPMIPNITIQPGDWVAHVADPSPAVILQVIDILPSSFISIPYGRCLEDSDKLGRITLTPVELPFFPVKEVQMLSKRE